MELDLGPEPALHPVDDHLDVNLCQPRDDLLARLRVAVDVERRVLLLEAADRRGGLLLVALGLGHANAITGAGRSSGGKWISVGFSATTSPARVSLSFATASMSPGQLIDRVHLLAPRRRELAHPLLALRVAFSTCESERRTPDSTRSRLIRPV